VTKDAVVAWIVEQNGAPMPQSAQASREMVTPLVPTIINGVVFVTSSGEFHGNDGKLTAAQRAQRSSPTVLYALEATTERSLVERRDD
jgi:hypothetical protein